MSRFTNEMIVVTGAGSGLGRGMAKRLIAEGAAVAAIDRAAKPLESLAKEFDGKRFGYAVADVTDSAAVTAAVCELEGKLGPVDRLIANAGIGRPTSAREFSAADFAEIVNVNLVGVANSVAAVLPGMIQRRHGHLVVISSLASFRGLPLMAAYCAGKAGVSALFDSLAVELKPLGIACTTVCPGWVRTPLTEQIKFKMAQIMEVDEAVMRILNVIRRRRRFAAFPWRLAMLLRVLRFLPPDVSDRIVGAMIKPPKDAPAV